MSINMNGDCFISPYKFFGNNSSFIKSTTGKLEIVRQDSSVYIRRSTKIQEILTLK